MSRFMQDINLSDVPELQALPDGTVVVEFESWEEKKASTGTPMAVICTKIIAPEDVAKKVGQYYLRVPLLESMAWRWRQIYFAAGILDKADGGFDPDDLLTLQLGIVLTLYEHNGAPRNNEVRFLPVGKAKPELRGKWEDVEAIEAGTASETTDVGEAAGAFG